MEKKIVLKVHRTRDTIGEVARINKDAQKRLSMAMHDTGCSAGYIVSQLIIQGCDFIEIEEEA